MKLRIITLSVAAILLLVLQSCSSTEKFYISSNTKGIVNFPYTAGAYDVAPSSENKIEVTSDEFYPFVIQTCQNGLVVPMGLDLHKRSHHGLVVQRGFGYALGSVGLGVDVVGLIAMIAASANGDDESTTTFGLMCAGGSGMAGVGAGIGAVASGRLSQTSYQYQFTYDRHQRLEIPSLSTTLIHEDPPKDTSIDSEEKSNPSPRARSGEDVAEEQTSRSSRSVGTLGKKIRGTYSGSGSLFSGRNEVESYSSVTIIIEPLDKNDVEVRVIESDEDFFDQPLIYSVTKDKSGGYKLTIPGLPQATITISKSGTAIFEHKKVNIDGDIYTLKISGRKK